MSLFGDIYDLYFNVGTGELGSITEVQRTVPAPEDTYERSVIMKRSGRVEDKVNIIHKALADFQPMTLDSKGALKLQTHYAIDRGISKVWKDLLGADQGGTNGSDERVKVLIQQTVSYCKTRYSMMCSGGDRLSKVNGDLFRSVAKEVGEVRWVKDGSLYVTTDSRTRLPYMGINPLFVLRAIIETFLKQVHQNKITNDVAGLEIIGKQVVCYLFMHEFSHIAYGHLNGIETHKAIFGEKKANYSFDSYINRNIENDEGWVTPDSGISTAQYTLIEAATQDDGTFHIVLTAFITQQDLFRRVDKTRSLSAIPNSLVGVMPICSENPEAPSMEWQIKKNIMALMNEKGVFTLDEKKQLADILNKNRPKPKPKPKPQPKPQPKPGAQPPAPPKPPEKPKEAPNTLTQEQRERLANILHKAGHTDDDIKAITGLGILPVWVVASSQKTPEANPVDPSAAAEIKKVAQARAAAETPAPVNVTPAPAPVEAPAPEPEPAPMIQPVTSAPVDASPAPAPAPEDQPMVQPVIEPVDAPVKKTRAPRKRPVTVEPTSTPAAAPPVQPMVMPAMPEPVVLPPAPAPVILPVNEPQPMVQPVMPAPVIMPEPAPQPEHPLVAADPSAAVKHGGGVFKMYDRIQVSPSGQIGMIASDFTQQGMYKIVVGPKSGYIDPARLTLLPRLYAEGDVVTITASGIKGTVTKVKPGVHDTLYISVIKNGKHFMYYADDNQVTKS